MAETETPTAEITERSGLLTMGFMEHLEELRKRIIRSFGSIVVGFCICYIWHEEIFAWIQKPITTVLSEHKMSTQLVYTNPVDTFNMYLKISLIAGIFLASPYILYQVWGFIAPGLYKNERRYVGLFMTIVLGLGVIFELPILVFFLALFGLITPGWMWRNIRYAILGIFIVAAAIAPTPDILSMCTFAAPMIILYIFSIGVAYMVHPRQRKARELKGE